MGKKCIPGLFCVENMTLFIVFVLLVICAYLYYVYFVKTMKEPSVARLLSSSYTPTASIQLKDCKVIEPNPLANANKWLGPFPVPEGPANIAQINSIEHSGGFNIFTPPVFTSTVATILPIATRGPPDTYSQIGILNRVSGSGDMILPLMGRRTMNGRDKYQYYTMSTTGNMSSRLPLRVNGKSCTSEYGCDIISDGDIVYVEGYNDTFRATIYDNDFFAYIPIA